ncbi:thiosulfate sulfurtransferase [Phanerochaete sordida]|uniref:Thiosulfate sulfurtransferase n=1 Tax=Phanerochaete sordida TaxID=48140 RepID=A0A9P3G0F6_9APHY|nr:thiosulfate sulfurtransferase [Phanerochaete sordida]
MSSFGDNCPLVITPRQLTDLDHSKLSILDASWHMPNSPRKAREEFLQKHIQGAQYLDLDEVASEHELGLKHMMPSPEKFAQACEQFGISPTSHVILYDTHGVFSSPRALFMFRAFGHNRSSILDGGLPNWEAHGCPVESGEAQQREKASYPVPQFDQDIIRSYEQILGNADRDPSKDPAAELVLDARPAGRWSGKDPEPRPGLSSGHIPHSVSLPFSAFLMKRTYTHAGDAAPGTYTELASPSALHSTLEEALGKETADEVRAGKRRVVTSCGSGMTAAVIWLGLKQMGVEKISLYDESWTGYAAREGSKIEKSE